MTLRRALVFLGVGGLLGVAVRCGGESSDGPDDGGAGGASGGGDGGGGGIAGEGGMPTTSTMTMAGGAGAGGAVGGAGGAGGEGIVWSEPPLHVEERCLGDVPLGEYAQFPIPPNTFGFTITGNSAVPRVIGLGSLAALGHSNVISNFDITGKSFDPFVHRSTVTGANPQSDLPAAQPMHIGDWVAVFGDDGTGGPVAACVYARRSLDGLPHGGVMDVNVRIAPAVALSQSYVQSVLDGLFTHYAPLAVAQGTVTFGALPVPFDVIADGDEYEALLVSTAGIGPRPAVNVMVVGDFSDTFGDAIGVAGGIPGTPMQHGTNQSGVALQLSGDAAYDAAVLAHEIGHLGGLFHTTELSLGITDPLSDTPECANTGDPDNCPDHGNLMFPLATGGGAFSADQLTVLQASMLYRGRVTDGGPPGDAFGVSPRRERPPPSAMSPFVQLRTARTPADAVERILGAIWCAHGGADHGSLVWRVATPARLFELARDEDAFDLVRARALGVLADFLATPVERAELVALARDLLHAAGSGRAALLAAIDILAEEDPAALGAAPSFAGDPLLQAELTLRR